MPDAEAIEAVPPALGDRVLVVDDASGTEYGPTIGLMAVL